MTKTINTWLPVFPGFYNTLYDPGEQLFSWEQSLRDSELVPEDWNLDFDYGAYTQFVTKQACEQIAAWFKYFKALKGFGITDVHMERIVSPSQYNFKNDSVDVSVNIDVEVFSKAFSEYLQDEKNLQTFKKYLKDHYTSYDGFMSYYSSHYEDWKDRTSDWKFLGVYQENDFNRGHNLADGSHSLGSILQFLIEQLHPSASDNLYYRVCENVILDDYVLNYPKDFDYQTANSSYSLSL